VGHREPVEARAPGRRQLRIEVQVAAGRVSDVVVPELAETPRVDTREPRGEPSSAGGAMRVSGIALGAAGVAAIGVGSYFGLRALSLSQSANDACPSGTQCSADALDAHRRADDAARVANFTMVPGLVALGAGALLYFLAPKSTGAVTVTARAGGAVFGASF
jgi:hypothetical protein